MATQTTRTVTKALAVKSARRTHLVDITGEVEKLVSQSGVTAGMCHLYCPHTTAGITVNEGDDPDVARDIENTLDRLVPQGARYQHYEGNADSHVKSTLVGVSAAVPIENGKLGLGRWQAIFFCEFDGPRERTVRVRITPDG
jgi:secondary thiamine-phosphate synthase enzyme